MEKTSQRLPVYCSCQQGLWSKSSCKNLDFRILKVALQATWLWRLLRLQDISGPQLPSVSPGGGLIDFWHFLLEQFPRDLSHQACTISAVIIC